MCQAKTDHSQDGYTLFELLVVVAIISMIVSVAPGAYARLVPNFQVNQYVNEVINVSRDLRRDAQLDGLAKTLIISPASNQIDAVGHILSAPGSVSISFENQSLFQTDGSTSVIFYPNGMSSGGSLQIERGTIRRTIAFDWVTGVAEVVQ